MILTYRNIYRSVKRYDFRRWNLKGIKIIRHGYEYRLYSWIQTVDLLRMGMKGRGGWHTALWTYPHRIAAPWVLDNIRVLKSHTLRQVTTTTPINYHTSWLVLLLVLVILIIIMGASASNIYSVFVTLMVCILTLQSRGGGCYILSSSSSSSSSFNYNYNNNNNHELLLLDLNHQCPLFITPTSPIQVLIFIPFF